MLRCTMLLTFHVVQLSKTKRANQFFVSDSFSGELHAKQIERNTNFHSVCLQAVFQGRGGNILFFFNKLFQLFNSKS